MKKMLSILLPFFLVFPMVVWCAGEAEKEAAASAVRGN
ncbi:unnamed protein product, partial [marine sediment metagenome]